MQNKPLRIAYFFTTFPKASEAFLQREITAIRARGVELEVYSLWGGGGNYRGIHINAQPRWLFFVSLLWWIPCEVIRDPLVLLDLLKNVFGRRAPSWLNFWENMLGAGFTAIYAHKFRRNPPDLVHAAWTGAPATAAWLMSRLAGTHYSTAAHAYDIYEHGGDWWLNEKLKLANFVHTSTDMARQTLLERGIEAAKIHVIRRGLDEFPAVKPLRLNRSSLRIVSVARLVEKKGFRRQMKIYSALKQSGVPFEVRIVGSGPMRSELEHLVKTLKLTDNVRFLGQVAPANVWDHLRWADMLVHSGVVTESGDRDGLPNVIPEAMSVGTIVLTSPTAATTEAVSHDQSGFVLDVDQPNLWVHVFCRLVDDDSLAERVRGAARRWVEEHYDAHMNAIKLHECFKRAVAETAGTKPKTKA